MKWKTKPMNKKVKLMMLVMLVTPEMFNNFFKTAKEGKLK